MLVPSKLTTSKLHLFKTNRKLPAPGPEAVASGKEALSSYSAESSLNSANSQGKTNFQREEKLPEKSPAAAAAASSQPHVSKEARPRREAGSSKREERGIGAAKAGGSRAAGLRMRAATARTAATRSACAPSRPTASRSPEGTGSAPASECSLPSRRDSARGPRITVPQAPAAGSVDAKHPKVTQKGNPGTKPWALNSLSWPALRGKGEVHRRNTSLDTFESTSLCSSLEQSRRFTRKPRGHDPSRSWDFSCKRKQHPSSKEDWVEVALLMEIMPEHHLRRLRPWLLKSDALAFIDAFRKCKRATERDDTGRISSSSTHGSALSLTSSSDVPD